MQKSYSIGLLLVLIAPFVCCEDGEGTRDEKLISTFQIVRFPNDPCVGSNSRNGTCYTSQECSDKSGTSSGSCADGFGVCCTFIITTCGSTSSENLTSWTQPATVAAGHCGLKICPIDDTICSLRLDFTTFAITGPSTRSKPGIRRRFGHPAHAYTDVSADGNKNFQFEGSSTTGECLTDAFYTRSANPSTGSGQLCGTLLTGEHLYLEADVDRCNDLSFYLADSKMANTGNFDKGVSALATRTWDITVSQIECTSKTNPPPGCTKYFWAASGKAVLKSAGYNPGTANQHLGQQHDRFCVRRERGMCVGCFATADSSFKVSGRVATTTRNYAAPAGCCGYASQAGLIDVQHAIVADNKDIQDGYAILGDPGTGGVTTGVTQFGWDCVIIPGAYIPTTAAFAAIASPTTAQVTQVMNASPTAATIPIPAGPQICGNSKGIGAGVAIRSTGQIHDKTNALLVMEGVNANLSICTRQTPFIMEWMSDDLEGLGGNDGTTNAGNSELHTPATTSQGFSITLNQLAC